MKNAQSKHRAVLLSHNSVLISCHINYLPHFETMTIAVTILKILQCLILHQFYIYVLFTYGRKLVRIKQYAKLKLLQNDTSPWSIFLVKMKYW